MSSGSGGRLLGSYPTDVRNGGGIRVDKQGLATRIAIDLRQTQRLTTLPAGGLVPVQDPGTGLIGALPVSALPTAQTGDGSQTNAKLATMPARTVKANLLNTTAPPRDVSFFELREALGVTEGGSVATNATNVSVVPPASQSYTNVQGAITSIEGRILAPGSGGSITSDKISDASTSGKRVLTGTPAQAREALEITTSGGPPVTAASISDSSASGRSVITGTPAQARTAIQMDKHYDALTISATPVPDWLHHTTNFDRLRVTCNNPSPTAWPGGGFYGTTSAITGVLRLPAEVGNNFDGSSPTVIINAGVTGLIETVAINAAAVGVYGGARMGITQGQCWGANFTVSNKMESIGGTSFNGQANGVEVDCAWFLPPGGPAGSNLTGIFIPAEFYGGRPDGGAAMLLSSRIIGGDFGWKQAIRMDHGSCDEFAELGMIKAPDAAGASGSSGFHWITSNGGVKETTTNPQTGVKTTTDTNDYRHSYLKISPDGSIILQPNFFNAGGTPGKFIVANSDLSQVSSMHPSNGFFGPRGEFNTLQVNQNGRVEGNLVVSNQINTNTLQVNNNAAVTGGLSVTTLQVNTNGRVEGNFTAGNNILAGVEVKGARGVFQDLYFMGLPVTVGAPNAVVQGYRALFIPN